MRTKKLPVAQKPMSRAEVLVAMTKPGRGKYGAIKTVVAGEKFDSIKEAERWKELLILLRAKEIYHLRAHPRMDIVINDIKVGYYTPDFTYWVKRGGEIVEIVEDVKSVATAKDPLWRFKKKVLAAIGIEVTEVI